MGAKEILDGLDWGYHPPCQVITPVGRCRNAACATAVIHANNSGTACEDMFSYVCIRCLNMLSAQLQDKPCIVPGCDRVGVSGFIRHVHPIPAVAS